MIRRLAILLTAVALAGCGGSSDEGVVGVWYDPSDDTTVTFSDDGRITVEGDGDDIAGDYRLIDDTQISLDLSQGGTETVSVVLGYELDGDTLVLIAPDGDTTRMNRQSP